MHLSDSTLVFAATDVSGFLACPHLTTLNQARALGGPKPPVFDDPGAEVLRQRGHEHEAQILQGYRDQGLDVRELDEPTWEDGWAGGWASLAEETLDLMRAGVDVICQACLFDGTWLGRPDFLVKVDLPSNLGNWSYEVVDAKLARSAKAGAVLQICFYSEMLKDVQGPLPEQMHLALGGPEAGLETFRVTDYAAYYRSVKGRFLQAVSDNPDTYPEPCTHCNVCAWSPVCKERWHADDHLSLVAGITRKQRAQLEGRGATTLADLAQLALPIRPALESVSDSAFEKIREQARIQLEGRLEGVHKYELFTDVEEGNGLLALPEPSDGDLFFDIEGDPHAFDEGLEYLLGCVDVDGEFTSQWALNPDEERAEFEIFIDTVMERLEQWPDLHIYHYAAYEQTAVKRLAARYATREEEVDRLLRGEVFVDLFRAVRQGLRASVESYSIKKLEPLYLFDREVDLRTASSALANFEAWLQLGGGEGADHLLKEIEGYNRDDCVSTLHLRDWLEERRVELSKILGRELPRPEPSLPDPSERVQEEIERVQRLMDALTEGVSADPEARTAEEHARWILAHLLSFHRREGKPKWWEYFRLMDLDDDELLHDSKPLAGLTYQDVVGQVKRSLIHRYNFPPQDFALREGDNPRDPATEASAGPIVALDADGLNIDLSRGLKSEVPHPAALIPFGTVSDQVLRESLWRLADDVVENGLDDATNVAAADLLLRRHPRVGQAPGENLRRSNETNLDAARRLAIGLDRTTLPIQGPPGSGKTHIGARMIVSLIAEGKRVGVTATSHKVITNLLNEVCAAAYEDAVEVRGIQKAGEESCCSDPAIECAGSNAQVLKALVEEGANLAAGTMWLWARPEMAESVDVLFVDEAGQVSLANVLAGAQAADSIVLLGDPQQLEQPQQGVHPPGTDVAALEHLVGESTLSGDRGLFLEETWRLHPDVCAFTSELFYEGRLTSRLELANQTVHGPSPFVGTGLRFIPVEHTRNSSESREEVEAVRSLLNELIETGAAWVDSNCQEHPIGLREVLVVAPYNAQVAALREALPKGARVGTVDKFQGQEAPIVIYSTATSSAQDAPRGMEFLFNPNRLNVATSRARCLAVLVGNPALLGPDCSSVRQMQLANGLCRFGEMADEGNSNA